MIIINVFVCGIDVLSVFMVINYDILMKGWGDVELDVEIYFYRIGWIGCFGCVGVSISFVYDKKSFMVFSSIVEIYGIDLVRLDVEDWDLVEEMVKNVIKMNRVKVNYVFSVMDKV